MRSSAAALLAESGNICSPLWRRFLRLTGGVGAAGRFLQHHMDIRTADAEGTHASATRCRAIGPGTRSRVEKERAVSRVDGRIGRIEMQERRQDTVAQGERRRDETRHAGSRVKVSDIGLRRAESTELAALDAAQAERLHQAGEFNGVAKRRRRTMGFDIANGGRIDAGFGVRDGNGAGLRIDAGSREADLVGAVVVDADTTDHGIDRILVGDGVVETFQQDNAGAAAEHRAAGAGIKRAANAIGRAHSAFFIEVAALLREGDRHTAGQRHVAASRSQVLHRQANRGHRGRACRLYRDGGPREAELVGGAGSDEITGPDQLLILADLELARELVDDATIGQDMLEEVGIHRGAGEYPDGAGDLRRIIAGVFERFPGDLEEKALLRVGQRCFARQHPEETGIEAVDVREYRPSP